MEFAFKNILFTSLVFIAFGCNINKSLSRYDFTEPHMGTLFKISLYAKDSNIACNAAVEAFQRVSTLNSALSDYDEKSETWQLNSDRKKTQKNHQPGEDLWQALLLSESLHERTLGAFDPSIGSLVRLWRRSRRKAELPTLPEFENALRNSGFGNISLLYHEKGIQFYRDELILDFGAIGKGIAADEVARVLKKRGIKVFLIDAGGDLLAGNSPPEQKAWLVEMHSSAKDTLYLELSNIAVATSGDLYQFVEIDGIQYSHIIDPRTGYAIKNQSYATVIAPTAAEADALASAFCILSLPEIDKIANSLKKPNML
jgi:FAD:protein FMN transferase